MIDARYFRDQLPADVAAAGEQVVVEVRMASGHAHRVRAVVSASDGYAVLERYEAHGEEPMGHEAWRQQVFGGTAARVERVAVAYEQVSDVVLIPGKASAHSRIGFGG